MTVTVAESRADRNAQSRQFEHHSIERRLLDVGDHHLHPVIEQSTRDSLADAPAPPVTTATLSRTSSMFLPTQPGSVCHPAGQPSNY
jgi:hypothetical protein